MTTTILASNYYSGPSIVGAYRAARWVIATTIESQHDVSRTYAHAQALFTEVVGIAPAMGAEPPAGAGELVLSFALALQHAHYHPVSKGEVRPLDGEQFEVGVEVIKDAIVTPLAECVCALIDEASEFVPEGTFSRVWNEHRNDLGFDLTDVFLHDRRTVARRIGVPVWYDGARRQFFGDGCNACLTSPGKTAATSRLGSDMSGDKQRTYRRLAACALPAPRQIAADDADEAVAAAQRIGYPVVLKPRWGKQGRGVTTNLTNETEIRAAYAEASRFGSNAVVEQFVEGADYRLLVINGRFVAAVKRVPARVTGDGCQSVQALIDESNRRDRRDSVWLFPLHVDQEMLGTLAAQGLGLGYVPQAGETVQLRRVANQSIGGTTIDVTDEVHPDNRMMAVAAARACLLDLAGLDFMTTDISRSWREGGAAIIEINSGPGIDLHMLTTKGKPRDVSWHLIRTGRPARAPGIVPRFMVTGEGARHGVSVRIAALMQRLGFNTGVLSGPGFTVGERELIMDSPVEAAETLFSLPDVDAVVVEQSLRDLAESGSLVERYTVAVLTDAGDDSLALESLLCDSNAGERIGDLTVWLASVTVINAAYAELRKRVAALPPQQAGYVWLDEADLAEVDMHIAAGGWAVVRTRREGVDWLEWRQNEQRVSLMPLEDNAENNAFAAAALIGAGHRPETVAIVLQGKTVAVPVTLAERGLDGTVQPAWPVDELESIFDGAWINRPGPGWQIGKIVFGINAVVQGSVAVIAGPPDDLAACAQLEAEVRDAFARGASAVIAPLVPDNLPRWRPVLVCDDPAAGYARLTGNALSVVQQD